MKKFESPILEVEEFEIMDVITSSTDDDVCPDDVPDCGDDGGIF